jgi:hypothetical protein
MIRDRHDISAEEVTESLIGRRQSLQLSGTVFVILAWPFLGMLWHHDYPLFAIESFIVLLAAALLAGFTSFLLFRTRIPIRNLFLAVLFMAACVVQFNLMFTGIIAAFAVGILAAVLFGRKFPELLLYVSIALVVGAWLDYQLDPALQLEPPDSKETQSTHGPVVHLMMDGFIGLDGLPGPAESEGLDDEILKFFEEYGFELHTRAYTHYSSTADSLTRAFGFRNDDENIFQRAVLMREQISFPDNQWFRVLDESGFPIAVYQSESMDFCDVDLSRAIACNVFPMPNLRTVHSDVENPFTRAAVLLRVLGKQSVILAESLVEAGILKLWGVSVYDDRMLPTIASDIAVQPRGAYFAHVLVPHSPLIYRADCSIDYSTEPWLRWPSNNGLYGNNDRTRRQRYKRIVPQTQCALQMLRQFFSSMEDQKLFDEATVIIHGDHGTSAYLFSPSVHNLDFTNHRDLRETYSTIFAVKWPQGEFRRIDEIKSLNVLMAETAIRLSGRSGQQLGIGVVSEEEPFIYFSDQSPLRKMYVNIFSDPDAPEK